MDPTVNNAASQRATHSVRNAAALLALMGASVFGSGGCVGTVYAVKANAAASRLEQARSLEAEELAPYEYYYAKAHLEKAMEEAASAEYGDAIDFADTAEQYADKAIELTRAAHRGAGR